MKYLLKVNIAITLIPLLIAVSFLPTYAQNTAPVPSTFEILSPSDGTLPFVIQNAYGTTNTRIFYGGDFADIPTTADDDNGFVGHTDPTDVDANRVGRGNPTGSRLTLGGTEYSDYQGTKTYMSYVANLPGSTTDPNSFDTDDIGTSGTAPDYGGMNGFIAINEEDSLVIRLTGYIDPNNRFKGSAGGAGYSGYRYESQEYAFDIADPANDSANGVRFGVVPSTLPPGATFNGGILAWVPNFTQGDGTYDNSVRNGIYFVDANISDGSTTSETTTSAGDVNNTAAEVGIGQGELRDSLYVIYFTATDDGIPAKTGRDSLFIVVNDSIQNPSPEFTQRDVILPGGNTLILEESLVSFSPDSALPYSEGDSIVVTFYATDLDSVRGGDPNDPLKFNLTDWSEFIRRPSSRLDSLALVDTTSILDGSDNPVAFQVKLQIPFNVADSAQGDTVQLVVTVEDLTNTPVPDTMLFAIQNINRPPIWDADTTDKPSDSAMVFLYDPAAAYPDSIDSFLPIAIANGVTDTINVSQYVYDPDSLISDPIAIAAALDFSTTSELADEFKDTGLMVITYTTQDTASLTFPVTVSDGNIDDAETASIDLILRVAPEPDIAEIYPHEGAPGQDITIFGSGFGLFEDSTDTPSRVIFRARNSSGTAQNLQATINSWSRDRINLTIPSNVPVSGYTDPPDVQVIPDTISVYSAVFNSPTYYPYVIVQPDTTSVENLEITNITATSAVVKWKTAFTGTDSVVVGAVDDTLDVEAVTNTQTYPRFVHQAPGGGITGNLSEVQVFRGTTSTTDELHVVQLEDLAPGVRYKFFIAMENELFFADNGGDLNGPYNPTKIDRVTWSNNNGLTAFQFKTLPAQNNNGEGYVIQGKVYNENGPATGAIVTVRIVDDDVVADTSLPLVTTVTNDSTWLINLGNAVRDTTGVADRAFVHDPGDYLIITIEADKDVGYTQFVTTRGTSSPQAVNTGTGGTLLGRSVAYDMKLETGLNLAGVPLDLFASEPQTARALLSLITQGVPSITSYDSENGTQSTITKAPGGFIGASDWDLADEDGNYYDAFFLAVDGDEYLTLNGSLYSGELDPVIFGGPALYWVSRPAQIEELFYPWSAKTMLANIDNASEIYRFNEQSQEYESAIIEQESGVFIADNNFAIDVSKGYILNITAASQWDINTPVEEQEAQVAAVFGMPEGVAASLTLNTSEANTINGQLRNVKLSDVTSSAAKISWVTNGASTVQVRYGEADEGLNKVAVFQDEGIDGMGYLHLIGLEPETEYRYEIVANGITYNDNGKPYAFHTAKIGTGNPYTVYGRLVDESGEPLQNAMVYVEAKRGDKLSTVIADLTDENGYWNANLANLKLGDGEVYTWNVGDELRVNAVYGDASTSFRTLVSGESPQNVVRVSDNDGVASQDKNEVSRVTLPKAFALGQNYPNPFNPSTTISYDIPDNQAQGVQVDLKVYNLRGQLVKTLVSEAKEPGHYVVQWDGTDERGETISSGVYFYRIKAGEFTTTRKMVLLK